MENIKVQRLRLTYEPYAVRKFKRALNVQYRTALSLLEMSFNTQLPNIISQDVMIEAYKDVYRKVMPPFTEIGLMETKQTDPFVQAEIDRYISTQVLRRITGVTEYTKETLRALIQDELDAGVGIEQAGRNIRKQLPSIVQWRAEMIARTEIVSASNAGVIIGADASGLDYQKMWVSALLPNRTRDSHAAAHGQIVGKNEPFRVGGIVLRYPGDPIGTPDEVINCLCNVAIVV